MAFLEANYNSTVIHLESHERDSGSTSSFQYALKGFSPLHEVRACNIMHLRLINNFYNVDSKHDSFHFTYAGTDYVVPIPVGYYTDVSQILDVLQTEINTVTGGLVQLVQYRENAPTQKLKLTFNVTGVEIPISKGWNEYPLNWILGFRETPPTVQGISIKPNDMIDLHPIKTVKVCCPEISPQHSYSGVRSRNSTCIAYFPIRYEFGSMIEQGMFDLASSVIDFHGVRGVTNLSLELKDDWGNLLDTHGVDWSITIKFYYS